MSHVSRDRCARCNHTADDHHEDGPDEPWTECAIVVGDRGCSCRAFIYDDEMMA